ncbi:MAG: NAD(P)/FAD-dependent oxidoreductase [Candidatus Fimivivens sp.]
MLLQLSQINTSVTQGVEQAIPVAIEQLGLTPSQVLSCSLVRTSIDARRGRRLPVHFVSTVALEVPDALGEKLIRENIKNLSALKRPVPIMVKTGETALHHRPVVVGFGPAGMFSALLLAQNGYRPIILERGAAMEERVAAVEQFWQNGVLDGQTNVQFGEGGAGTFSDGKLTTRIHDPLCGQVLNELVRHGAPQDILVKAKPHIGTDLLRGVVKSIRNEILALGGEIHFLSCVKDFQVQDGAIRGVVSNGGFLAADAVIAAVGHSARDTFAALAGCGAALEPKAFSVGVRIEHLQTEIDRALYGDFAGHPNLPSGEYQLSHREGQRAAYTFCMCPGGMVAAAASGEGQVVTNGMSYRARNLKNANSALVVSVDSTDYGGSWQDAIAFQQRLESAAFNVAGKDYKAPCMRVADFLQLPLSSGNTRVEPSYPVGVKEADIAALFPPQIAAFMRHALPILGRKLSGFDAPSALLTGVETRTSSPVRMMRRSSCMAESIDGLYPCGEGAGYAGGIMSAAVDGLRCALALMNRYKRPINGKIIEL